MKTKRFTEEELRRRREIRRWIGRLRRQDLADEHRALQNEIAAEIKETRIRIRDGTAIVR